MDRKVHVASVNAKRVRTRDRARCITIHRHAATKHAESHGVTLKRCNSRDLPRVTRALSAHAPRDTHALFALNQSTSSMSSTRRVRGRPTGHATGRSRPISKTLSATGMPTATMGVRPWARYAVHATP